LPSSFSFIAARYRSNSSMALIVYGLSNLCNPRLKTETVCLSPSGVVTFHSPNERASFHNTRIPAATDAHQTKRADRSRSGANRKLDACDQRRTVAPRTHRPARVRAVAKPWRELVLQQFHQSGRNDRAFARRRRDPRSVDDPANDKTVRASNVCPRRY